MPEEKDEKTGRAGNQLYNHVGMPAWLLKERPENPTDREDETGQGTAQASRSRVASLSKNPWARRLRNHIRAKDFSSAFRRGLTWVRFPSPLWV